MAEAAACSLIPEERDRFFSCGVLAKEGSPVSRESAEAVRKRFGEDISSHRARRFSEDFLDRDTLVLCMDGGHLSFIEQMKERLGRNCPVRTLMGFAGREGDIKDPIYSGQDTYDTVLAQIVEVISAAKQRILNWIEKGEID